MHTMERKLYVETGAFLEEIASLPPELRIDTVTFSGRGEPTLAANLGEAISAVQHLRREPVAVLTNSSLIGRQEVCEELQRADIVVAKLDACSDELLRAINRPATGISYEAILDGLIAFRRQYQGKLAVQIMFVEENRGAADELARVACRIGADEVQVNTPLRPGGRRPLDRLEIAGVARCFRDLPVRSVYEAPHRDEAPIRTGDPVRRRGKG